VGYEFEWDPAKERSNRRKHGVSFDEATTVFGDSFSLNMPDPSHSATEDRFLVLGRSARGRLLVVAYAERGPRTRLVSARKASPTERRRYEEA
jgi:uncharacterized DUF497 family protein